MNTVITEKCRIPGCGGELVAKRTLLGALVNAGEDGSFLHECNRCEDGFQWLEGIYPRALIPGFDDLDETMEDICEATV